MSISQSLLPSQIQVTQSPASIDYTSKDYTGFVQSMLAYAATIMPAWNTSSPGDMGVAIVELLAYCLDIQSYYGDRISQEAYLPTATQRLSLLNIAQLLGYVPSNGAPAAGTVTFETESASPDVVIPAGTQVSTSTLIESVDAPVIYQTDSTVTCDGAGGTVTVAVTQGITSTQVQIGTSDGTPGQTFQIPQPGVIDGSTQLLVETVTGFQQWQQVPYLVDTGAEDMVFAVAVDQNGLTTITLGDGLNGLIPAVGLTIWATYTIGVGAAGNQAAGIVGTIVTSLAGLSIPLLGDGITYNSSAMGGGSDPETNDQIRANAPAAFRAQRRAIGLQDYADLARGIPGVLLASATANHDTSVTLYILGPNYLAPGAALQDSVLDFFEGKTGGGTTLSVGSPSLIPVDVGTSGNKVQLQVLPTYSQQAVLANVQVALQALLSPPSMQFNQLLNVSQIYSAINAVDGVDYVVIPVFTREDAVQSGTTAIQFRPSEIPVPGSNFVNVSGGF